MNGWLVVDKPAGMSSAQVVARVKRLLKPSKIGHAGTLDPFATGVLPLALGEATKTAGYGLDKDKSYDFTLTFGEERDTGDLTGKITATSDKRPTLAEIEAVLPLFRGEISQVPPAYSAIHVNGRRAYEMARKGEAVELAARQVTIHHLTLLSSCGLTAGSLSGHAAGDPAVKPQDDRVGDSGVDFSVICSKGTYIRSLAADIARKLGSLGYVSALRRLGAGPFTLKDAISLENLEKSAIDATLLEWLKPVSHVLDDIPVMRISAQEATFLRHGKSLNKPETHDLSESTLLQMRYGEELVAIVKTQGNGILKSLRVFNN